MNKMRKLEVTAMILLTAEEGVKDIVRVAKQYGKKYNITTAEIKAVLKMTVSDIVRDA